MVITTQLMKIMLFGAKFNFPIILTAIVGNIFRIVEKAKQGPSNYIAPSERDLHLYEGTSQSTVSTQDNSGTSAMVELTATVFPSQNSNERALICYSSFVPWSQLGALRSLSSIKLASL